MIEYVSPMISVPNDDDDVSDDVSDDEMMIM